MCVSYASISVFEICDANGSVFEGFPKSQWFTGYNVFCLLDNLNKVCLIGLLRFDWLNLYCEM